MLLADRQQLLVGDEDAVVALGRDGEDPAAEGVAAGVLQQRRVDPAADDLLVGFQRLLLGDDAGLLQRAPVGGADVLDELRRASGWASASCGSGGASPRRAKRGGTVSRVWPRNMAK